MFLIAEPLILVLGLGLALARQARVAWLTPLRLLAVLYTDLFRGIPTILLVVLLAFGMPALQLQGVPNDRFFWALVALVLSYGAYVAEVFRSGIESVHPSQLASAETLGLTRAQALRHVVVPQAVRRVVPPLLNDFVSLQKDTALVSTVGIFDAVFAARDYGNYNFNDTPLWWWRSSSWRSRSRWPGSPTTCRSASWSGRGRVPDDGADRTGPSRCCGSAACARRTATAWCCTTSTWTSPSVTWSA